jgi:hypothetical protein
MSYFFLHLFAEEGLTEGRKRQTITKYESGLDNGCNPRGSSFAAGGKILAKNV